MAASISGTLRRLSMALLLGLFLLGGCQTTPTTTHTSTCELAFMSTGGVLGGVLGYQIGSGSGQAGATVIGIGLGLVSGHLAARRACADERVMNTALDNTPDGESTSWQLHQTGDEITVTPQTTFQRDGQQCRDFEMVVLVDGVPRSTTGTACRRSEDQAWTTV